jgi:murein DD-endopeptidase MepM/ murein hydrolase activator NlpD
MKRMRWHYEEMTSGLDSRRSATAALALAAVLSLGAGAARGPVLRVEAGDSVAASGPGTSTTSLSPAPCPVGSLPDGEVCVRLAAEDDGPEAEPAENAHHDRRGRWIVYDQIPRRPDRPADYDAYLYPVPCARACVVSGYDLDRPDESQRRGARLSHVGHGAVDLPQTKGTPITLVALEHQEGDAEVVFVGALFGSTVITRHTLREGGQLRDYLLLFGHLDAPAPGITTGRHLAPGELVGFVGDTGSPELVHLHLEARRVRTGVDLEKLAGAGGGAALIANENSVVCDPRNVLPLREP